MKSNLNIQKTALSPNVYYDGFKNCIVLEGRSIPFNAEIFWNPILSWYTRNRMLLSEMTIIFHFDYLNSGSQQYVLKLLKLVSESKSKGFGNSDHIIWKFEGYDIDMFELGQDIEFVSGLKFKFEKLGSDSLKAA